MKELQTVGPAGSTPPSPDELRRTKKAASRQNRALQMKRLKRSLKYNYDLYLLLIPVVAYFIIFAYWPMYGVQIAFKNYSPAYGIAGSEWVGLEHLKVFFNSFYFERLLRNTFGISVYSILIGIPAPIILALLFQEIRNKKARTVIQAISYAPNFMSLVVVCGMIILFLNPRSGLIPALLGAVGITDRKSTRLNSSH